MRLKSKLFDSQNTQTLCRRNLFEHSKDIRIRIDKGEHIQSVSKVSNTLFNTFSGNITVEDYAFMGHNVSLLTGTHDIGLIGEERMSDIPTSGRDIIVGEGVWIGSNSIILGPCRIGKNSVIAANSVILKDVY